MSNSQNKLPAVDFSAIKVGDKVTVELTVNSAVGGWSDRISMCGSDPSWTHAILRSDIIGHTPKPLPPLAIGDKFKGEKTGGTYIVVALPTDTRDTFVVHGGGRGYIDYDPDIARGCERIAA